MAILKFKKGGHGFFKTIDPAGYYIRLQDKDFITSVMHHRQPIVTGADGRKTVELFNAIYKSSRENKVVRWPL